MEAGYNKGTYNKYNKGKRRHNKGLQLTAEERRRN